MSYHTVFNMVNGIYVCGINEKGQLGLDDTINRKVPTLLNFECEVISIHCSNSCTIFKTTDGIYVCGDNAKGQLGLGDTISRQTPTKLPFDHDVISIHCGGNQTVFNTSRRIKSAATMI
jgi:alpha-tubulin suppressor-like RCC1 family protein